MSSEHHESASGEKSYVENGNYQSNNGYYNNDRGYYGQNQNGYPYGHEHRYCGYSYYDANSELNTNSTGLNIVSFLFPLVGLILFLVYIDKAPIRSKGCGKWALIGVVVNAIVIPLLYFFGFVTLISAPYAYGGYGIISLL